MSTVDPMDELFDELWSMEYRISGDKPRAKELAREFLDRHAHLLAEKIRNFRCIGCECVPDQCRINHATQAFDADLIDPEVTV